MAKPMWIPGTLGDLVAERVCEVKRAGRKAARVRVRFGKPVRARTPETGDPWWCPVEVTGMGIKMFRPIAGVDSLQALILALEFATQVVPAEVRHLGGTLQWLGDPERIIFARQGLSHAAGEVIVALLGRLKMVAAILDSGTGESPRARRRAIEALAAIGESVGFSSAKARTKRRAR